MNDLVKAYYDHLRNNRIHDNLGIAIANGVWPFKVGPSEAYVHEDFERGRTLRVIVKGLPDHDFVMSLDLISLTREPDGGLSKIYERVFKHYRYRPALPVDDHIVLGEE
jgi:hypothetical protein